MRMPIIAGNWKMNTTATEAAELVKAMKKKLNSISGVEKVLCPPFISLTTVKELIKGTSIKLGAQNMYFEPSGAYTGEVAPQMLAELCEFVILGHSERRAYFGETDQIVNTKVRAALGVGLKPIVCVGESLDQNEAGRTVEVVERQVKGALEGAGNRRSKLYPPGYESDLSRCRRQRNLRQPCLHRAEIQSGHFHGGKELNGGGHPYVRVPRDIGGLRRPLDLRCALRITR